jgi:hypothetical protein
MMDYGKAVLVSNCAEKDLLPVRALAMPSPLSFVHLIWRSFPDNCLALISRLLSNNLPRNAKQDSALSRRSDESTSIDHKLACPIFMKNNYEINHFIQLLILYF